MNHTSNIKVISIITELADNIMLAQVAVFIFGAIETSSTTLSYCLHELAYHPEEQVFNLSKEIKFL